MPRNQRSGAPGPLDNLPRPLSERESRGRGRRRLTALLTAVVVVGVIAVAANTVASSATAGAGQVAGAITTPAAGLGGTADPVQVADGTQVPDATKTPDPTPAADPSMDPPVAAAFAVHDMPEPVLGPSHGPTPANLTGYRWPLTHARLTLPFGPTPWGGWVVDGKLFHDGIDLATFCGDRIVAAHSGVVIAAGRHFDKQIGWVGSLDRYFARLDKKHLWMTLPNVVIIDDGNGYRSIYAHFGKVVVKAGQTVKAGKLLGYEGATGRATGCHLHYGLFSPFESTRFATDPAVAKRMKLPRYEIARIDPRLVLPRHATKKPTAADASTQDAP